MEASQAAIDLTRAAIMLPDLGVAKPDGETASLELTAEKKADGATIPNFQFKSKAIEAHGSAELFPTVIARKASAARRVL